MDTQAGLHGTRWGEHDDEPGLLLDAIERSIRCGDVESALGLLRSIRRRFMGSDSTATASGLGLTEREAAALALLFDASLSQKDMARVLGISHNTLKTHLRSVYQKIGAHSRGEVIERVGAGGHHIAVTGHRYHAAA